MGVITAKEQAARDARMRKRIAAERRANGPTPSLWEMLKRVGGFIVILGWVALAIRFIHWVWYS